MNILLIDFLNTMQMPLADIDIYRGQVKLSFNSMNDLRRHWGVPIRSVAMEEGRLTVRLVTAPYLYSLRYCWDGTGRFIGNCHGHHHCGSWGFPSHNNW